MGECGQRVKKETEIGLGDEGVNVESNKTKNQTVSSKRIKQVKSHQDPCRFLPGVRDQEWKEKNSRTEQREE